MSAVELLDQMNGVKMSEKSSKDFEKLLKSGKLKRGNDTGFNLQAISTGLATLDTMLGGGLIRSRYYQFVGEPSSGKSFLAMRMAKDAIEKGLTVAVIDTEHSYDQAWIIRQGIDPEKLLVSQSNIGTDVIDIVVTLLENEVDLVIVDSLMGMIPNLELEEDAAKDHRQLHPKLISLAVRKWMAANTNSVLVLVNHIRDMEHIPGGTTLTYFSHGILRVKRAGWIMDGLKTVGYNMRITLKKSKQSVPWTKLEIPFTYQGLLDELGADADLIMEKLPDLVEVKSAWIKYGEKQFHGRSKFVEFLNANPEVHADLMEQVLAKQEEEDNV